MIKLEIKRKMSTAFYLQTDEQIKQLNQTLKQYLRTYINEKQNDWIKLLFTTQLIYNNTNIKTLNFCFRKIQTKQKDNLFIAEEKTRNIAVDQLSEELLLKQRQLRENLIIVKERIKDQKSKKEKIFKKEDKIYLQTRNFDMRNKIKKLKHTAENLFKIIRNIRNTVYELNISNFKIHNVFNASLLNKTDERVSLIKKLKTKARKKEYKVKEILKERKNKRKKE